MLSTRLYTACISMESMMGPDMVKISRPMGMVPRMFFDCDMALAPFSAGTKGRGPRQARDFPKNFERTV